VPAGRRHGTTRAGTVLTARGATVAGFGNQPLRRLLLGMRDDKSALLEQAQRCRRLARAINTTDVVEKLLTMAEDYEEQAARLAASGPPLVPSEAPGGAPKVRQNGCRAPGLLSMGTGGSSGRQG
jgi:hypothetical protein